MRHAVTPACCRSRLEYERPRRIAGQTSRVASRRVALRVRVRFTYYHRRNAREDYKYNYYKPAGAVRSRNALAKCTSHEAALGTVAHTRITLRVIIKGCGRKLHTRKLYARIYWDHYLSSMLQRCIENLLRVCV